MAKAISEKFRANIIFNDERLKMSPLIVDMTMPSLLTSLKYSILEYLAKELRQ
jgi:hypothetical protein